MKTIPFISCLLYVLAATLTDGAIINVKGFEGINVSFQCSHILAWSNNKYFCKDPCKSTEDRLVTVESGRRAESGRITLVDSGDGSFTVTFSHLQLSDSQKYWCAVDRPGFDTYTEVRLTVKKAVETESTVIRDVSSMWTYQNTNTTHFTTGTGAMEPTKLPTSLNFNTEEEPKISTGTIVYATVGGVGLISILLLAVCFRKTRKTSKHKIEVYCNITDVSNASEREQDRYGYDDTDKKTNHSKMLFESSSVSTHQQRPDPPTSEPTATKYSVPLDIYENISFSKLPAGSGYSPTEDQNDYDNNSGIYINVLPALVYERTGDGTCTKHTNKPNICKNTESCKKTPCVSRAPVNLTKRNPDHFGLV